jgi:hypothetical protein
MTSRHSARGAALRRYRRDTGLRVTQFPQHGFPCATYPARTVTLSSGRVAILRTPRNLDRGRRLLKQVVQLNNPRLSHAVPFSASP